MGRGNENKTIALRRLVSSCSAGRCAASTTGAVVRGRAHARAACKPVLQREIRTVGSEKTAPGRCWFAAVVRKSPRPTQTGSSCMAEGVHRCCGFLLKHCVVAESGRRWNRRGPGAWTSHRRPHLSKCNPLLCWPTACPLCVFYQRNPGDFQSCTPQQAVPLASLGVQK